MSVREVGVERARHTMSFVGHERTHARSSGAAVRRLCHTRRHKHCAPKCLRWHDVWEFIVPVGSSRWTASALRDGRAGDEGEHDFGCVVGQRPAVAGSEAVCRRRAYDVGQDVGE